MVEPSRGSHLAQTLVKVPNMPKTKCRIDDFHMQDGGDGRLWSMFCSLKAQTNRYYRFIGDYPKKWFKEVQSMVKPYRSKKELLSDVHIFNREYGIENHISEADDEISPEMNHLMSGWREGWREG